MPQRRSHLPQLRPDADKKKKMKRNREVKSCSINLLLKYNRDRHNHECAAQCIFTTGHTLVTSTHIKKQDVEENFVSFPSLYPSPSPVSVANMQDFDFRFRSSLYLFPLRSLGQDTDRWTPPSLQGILGNVVFLCSQEVNQCG